MSKESILALIDVAKHAQIEASRVKALAKHFQLLAEQIESGEIVAENITIESHVQTVKDCLRHVKSWHLKAQVAAKGVTEPERQAVVRVLKKKPI